MPLGMEVGFGTGDIVLCGDPGRPERGTAAAPSFQPMSIVAKQSPISATAQLLFQHGTTDTRHDDNDENDNNTQ